MYDPLTDAFLDMFRSSFGMLKEIGLKGVMQILAVLGFAWLLMVGMIILFG